MRQSKVKVITLSLNFFFPLASKKLHHVLISLGQHILAQDKAGLNTSLEYKFPHQLIQDKPNQAIQHSHQLMS